MKKIIIPAVVLIAFFIYPGLSAQQNTWLQKLQALEGTELTTIEKNLPLAIIREAATRTRGQFSVLILSGENKTKKQNAARFLGQKIQADVYRADLSLLVSRNNGETEKNLRTVFQTVKTANGILYLDEGAALFGRRTTIKDAHDRYDDEGTNYFLQLVREYRIPLIISVTAGNEVNPLIFEKFVRIAI